MNIQKYNFIIIIYNNKINNTGDNIFIILKFINKIKNIFLIIELIIIFAKILMRLLIFLKKNFLNVAI